jgi:8-hydroxy-5-deazaflavin:NADPH oxidoreductase
VSIGIIGAGSIGQVLARRLAAAGEDVVVSNRSPRTLEALVDALGPRARAGSVAEAATADVVVLAVPWRSLPAAVAATEVTDWRGRVVVDPTNPLGPPDFRVADLGGRTSSEVVADLVAGARLVKAFNTLDPAVLDRAPDRGGRRVVFVSGDHPEANAAVAALAGRAGWAPIDLGPLALGGRLQQFPGGPLATLPLLREG